jgi:hypothetical protein
MESKFCTEEFISTRFFTMPALPLYRHVPDFFRFIAHTRNKTPVHSINLLRNTTNMIDMAVNLPTVPELF